MYLPIYKMIMDFLAVFAELLGTFIFISVILLEGTALAIGITLIAVIFLIGRVSGAHVNPAISFVMWMKKDISSSKLLTYIVAQLIGGYLALLWYRNTILNK
jgi:glycerol uptake facilitator-like aquaporin